MNFTLEDVFNLVAKNSFHMKDKQRDQLFQQICHELEERYSIERKDLRNVMKSLDLKLEEYCKACNDDLDSEIDSEDDMLCDVCKKIEKNKNKN